MTYRKKESALGRGLDALIRPEFVDEKKNQEKLNRSTNKGKKKGNVKSSSRSKKQSKNNKSNLPEIGSKEKDMRTSIDMDMVENVILEVRKNPRISLWSAKSAAVLRLLKKTKPEFSISKEASALIEQAVKEKYPYLWEEFEDREI
jgi:hypothetical protein